MSDQAENAVDEVEALAPEQGNAEASELDQELAEELAAAEPEEGEEFAEVEYDGKVYNVPPELKDALLRQQDYTRKTQEVAETRKALEARQADIQRQAALQQRAAQLQSATFQDRAALASIEQSLSQFAQVDWAAAIEADPVEAQKLQAQYAQLKDARMNLATRISQQEQAITHHQQQELARLVAQGREVLQKEIEGWSDSTKQELAKYGVEKIGFQPHEIANVYDPRQVKVLHKAYLYDQMMSKAQSAPQVKTEAKPTKRVGAGRASAKDPSRMSTDEFIRWRNAQVAKSS